MSFFVDFSRVWIISLWESDSSNSTDSMLSMSPYFSLVHVYFFKSVFKGLASLVQVCFLRSVLTGFAGISFVVPIEGACSGH